MDSNIFIIIYKGIWFEIFSVKRRNSICISILEFFFYIFIWRGWNGVNVFRYGKLGFVIRIISDKLYLIIRILRGFV